MVEKHTTTPFDTLADHKYVLVDLDKINQLGEQGRIVLKHVVFYLDVHTGTSQFNTEVICIAEFGVYDEVYRKRIRRGINNLLSNKVISKTDKRHIYWVNKAIVWK